MIKAYGGGFYAYRRRLSAAQLRSLRAAVADLPLGRAPKVARRERESHYQPPPAQFIVRTKGYAGSFPADAQPRNARPLVAHLLRVIHGKEGGCRETFGTRVRG